MTKKTLPPLDLESRLEAALQGRYSKCQVTPCVIQKSQIWVSRGWCQTLFSGAQWQDKKQWPGTKPEVPPQHEEELPLRVAGHRDSCPGSLWSLSGSGDIQNPPGHLPVSPALGDPALAGAWMRWSPEMPSSPNNFVIQNVETDPSPALSFKGFHFETTITKKYLQVFLNEKKKEQKKTTYGTWQWNWITNPVPVQLNNF